MSESRESKEKIPPDPGRWKLYPVFALSGSGKVARKISRAIQDLMEIEGMGNKRSETFGPDLIKHSHFYDRQEPEDCRIEDGEQSEAAGNDAPPATLADIGSQNRKSRGILVTSEINTPKSETATAYSYTWPRRCKQTSFS